MSEPPVALFHKYVAADLKISMNGLKSILISEGPELIVSMSCGRSPFELVHAGSVI